MVSVSPAQPYGGSAFQSFPILTPGTTPLAPYATPAASYSTPTANYSPYTANSATYLQPQSTPYLSGTTTLPLNSAASLSPSTPYVAAASYRSLPQSNVFGSGYVQPSTSYSMGPVTYPTTTGLLPSTAQPVIPESTVGVDTGMDLTQDGIPDEEEPEPMFVPLTIEKPVTKWKTATDVEGEFPAPQPLMPAPTGLSIVPGYHHTRGQPRQVDTDPAYWNTLNEESGQPWPFWIGAGTPAARMEPTWQDGNWYLVAPVDFKGMEDMKRQGKWSPAMEYDTLNSVDQAVRDLDAQGHIAPLPPPRHWKEHKGCPIA